MIDYIILSIDNCPYCDKAKAVFDKCDISYTEINCADEPDVAILLKKAGRTTFPLVLNVIGGFTELDAKLNQTG